MLEQSTGYVDGVKVLMPVYHVAAGPAHCELSLAVIRPTLIFRLRAPIRAKIQWNNMTQ